MTTAILGAGRAHSGADGVRPARGGGDRRAVRGGGGGPPRLDLGSRAHDRLAARRLRARLLAEPQLHLPLRGASRAGCPPRATPRSSPSRCAALRYMVLPAVSLGFNQSALIARISRSCMLEALQQDYVRTARAKGLPQRAVTYVHAFRNALVPVVTVIGVTTAVLIGGAVVTEIVFNIPGPRAPRDLGHPAPRLPGGAGGGAGDGRDLRADQPGGGPAVRLHRSAHPL